MTWATFTDAGGRPHVVPCGDDGELLPAHRVAVDCPCLPRALRERPLDEPIIVHREPGHPGADTKLDA